MRNNRRKGFTLVEIMIVVLIIGILLAIAIPNFIKSRQNSRLQTIVANLRQIENAKEQCAMDKGVGSGDTTACAQSVLTDAANGYMKAWPTGPLDASKTYAVGAIGTAPTYDSKNADTWKSSPTGL
jgi:prepilin-type N-terminal cleavage/methylation domain-containing protein